MSELKTFNSERIYWAVEQVEREAGDIDGFHLDDTLFYLKSEADKVIAEKDKKIDLYKRGFKEDDKTIKYLHTELRHHKYKRCLAMAKWCRECSWTEKVDFYYNWYNRWLEIAEKFEEVSDDLL